MYLINLRKMLNLKLPLIQDYLQPFHNITMVNIMSLYSALELLIYGVIFLLGYSHKVFCILVKPMSLSQLVLLCC